MADGQKPIKNSLLSAATSSSFFEDAALFVPVPLVESGQQETAIEEIDLNSDDSSPNRGSMEKEFAEQLTLQEPSQEIPLTPPHVEEQQPLSTISLFSRAATTGGDLFSRMLSGSSSHKSGNANVALAQEDKQTAKPQLYAPASAVREVEAEEAPSVVNLFAVPPTSSQSSSISQADFLSSTSDMPVQMPNQSVAHSFGETEVGLSSTVFSGSGSAFVPTLATRKSPNFQSFPTSGAPVAVPPPVGSYPNYSNSSLPPLLPSVPPSVSAVPSFTPVVPLITPSVPSLTPSVPSLTPSVPSLTPSVPSLTPSVPSLTPSVPSLTPSVPSLTPSVPSLTPSVPLLTSSVPSLTPSVPSIAPPVPSLAPSVPQLTPSMPSLTPSLPSLSPAVPLPAGSIPALTGPPVQGGPPPPTGNANAFRLGGQKMKYVACPEMPAAPSASGVPPPQNPFNSTIGSTTCSQPPLLDPSVNMGSNISQQSSFFTDLASAENMTPRQQQYSQSPTTPPRPLQSTFYGTPGVIGLGYIPQELPPLTYHWFYRRDADGKIVWKPFSIIDSVALEDAFANDPGRLVPTDGGRYDVCVQKRVKTPVYWEETPIEVRRGCWFFKGPMDNRFIPYDEEFAAKLETEYADCMRNGVWQKRLEFPEGESVIMHSAGVVVHFCQAAAPDDWGNLPESQIRPRVVKRGVEEIEVEDGESTQIDHLIFVVHGIGPICDFKLRNIVEAVDDFRGLSFQLLHSHFRDSTEKSLVGRVEFLPVSWHKALHGDKGIDEQLKRITLRSIPKFRDFTNDTLLDILFYTSPVYCQTIVDSVGSELNRIYKMFLSRNPSFHGKVSLTGHSLGSLILFDLLIHQPVAGSVVSNNELNSAAVGNKEVGLTAHTVKTDKVEMTDSASSSRTVSYTVGTAGTGQPFISYPTIDFTPCAFFALGSPIAMFVTVRGIENLGNDFRLPTCPAFFNIFHPYDPVAYRIETLIDPDFQNRPVLIPHHKGRKRIHLELKETMARVGADIKHKVIDAVKTTINTVYHYTGFNRTGENLDNEIQSAIAGEMEKKAEADGAEDENAHIRIGCLNGGRRIDHVLQEAPYETFNEYVFAMSTHVGYWESEDTMLLILTEIYGSMGIQRDRHVVGAHSISSPTHLVRGVPNSSENYHSPSILSQYESSAYLPSAPPMQTTPSLINMGSVTSPSAFGPVAPRSVPMMQPTTITDPVIAPPNPLQPTTGSPQPFSGIRAHVIGNRPVVDPSQYPRGMDPTAPMLTLSQVAPPPKIGFVPKPN